MKRILMLLLAVTLVFGIAACDDTDPDPVCESPEVLIDGECVAPNVPPVLAGLEDVAMSAGDDFDALDGVTATDDEDGDITSDIEVSNGEGLNYFPAGTYEVIYSVTDSAGDTTTETRTVVIAAVNQAPVLTGVYDLNIVLLDTFDATAGVVATDLEDGDITADIVITGTVDSSVLGPVTLTYTITDADGAVVTMDRVVTVNAARVNNAPSIAGAVDVTVVVGGTFDPMAGIVVSDFEDTGLVAVLTGDTLDLATAGTYVLTYTATDLEGAVTVVTRTVIVNTLPVFVGLDDLQIYVGDAFDPAEGVSASDAEDGDLTAQLFFAGTIDTSIAGEYVYTYSVSDGNDGFVTVDRTISVMNSWAVYPTGFYNFKFATTELRHTFMAAAESYLLNTNYAGIPLFANGGYNMYHARVQLPVDAYVAIMGFGTAWATMSADDSTVIMDDGLLGEVGEYTYRTTVSNNPDTWNQWLYEASTDATLMGVYMDGLYAFEFNAAKDGFDVNPSMASADPIPMNTELTETGKEVATTWRITIREDLEWFYHPSTDISGFPTGHEAITAVDFVETFELALAENWFRAVAGGGDFTSETNQVVNAQEFADGEVAWSEVGIKLIDDYTFEFQFTNQMSEWNMKYWLSGNVITPINMDLYDSLQDGELNSYGTSETTIAYHGAFYAEYYEISKVIRMRENPNYHSPDDFFFTGYNFYVQKDSAIRFAEFLDNKLDAVGVPTENYDAYKDDPRIIEVPGVTTFRMMINGLGTVEAQQEQFPGSTWVPEPILANANFKSAMYFVIDRQKLAEEVLRTSTTNMYLFSDAYVVDGETGIPYRTTPEGLTVSEGLSPSTHGFNEDAAIAYFKLAVQQLVDTGDITPGTEANPTVITLGFNIFSGSEAQVLMGEYLKAAFEAAFVDDVNHVQVELNVVPKDFPGIYYDYMMIGEFDLSIGGIAGSTLDAASFLDTYSSDNRSGFTLNWGIDTTQSDIEVVYYDFDGVRHHEMWSFDAIYSALNGEVLVVDGAEGIIPTFEISDITETTATIFIDQFDSADFTDITYSVLYYDLAAGVNLPLAGYQDIDATTQEITITGLVPYFYGYQTDGSLLYRGDYVILIEFVYTADLTKSGSYEAPWFPTLSVIEAKAFTFAVDSGTTIDLTISEVDLARTVASVLVFEEQADESMLDITSTVDFTDLTAISMTGLTPGAWYIVEFTFSDGLWQTVWFTAPYYIENSIVATDTGAVLDITLDSTLTIDTAIVYDADDVAVVGAAVDFTTLTAIAVTGLTAETDYYVEFTFTNGDADSSDITTEATPAT